MNLDMAICLAFCAKIDSYENFKIVRNKLNELEIPNFTIELIYKNQEKLIKDSLITVKHKGDNNLIGKYNLYNILSKKIPIEFDKLCFIDSDVIFNNKNWYNLTIEKLKENEIVRPFEFGFWKNNKKLCVLKNIDKNYLKFDEYANGFAWAFDREFFENINGFYEEQILGLEDLFFSIAITKNTLDKKSIYYNEYFEDSFNEYVDNISKYNFSVGFVPGECVSLNEFEDKNIICNKNFEITKNKYGVLEFSENKFEIDINLLIENEKKLNGDLAIISTYWNPADWNNLKKNYLKFTSEINWWKVPVFSVEIAYEWQNFINNDSFIKIRGKEEKNIIWQKERLINLAVEKLPKNFDKVAWIDSDIYFLDSNWINELCETLNKYSVVQLWNNLFCIGPNGKLIQKHYNVGKFAERYISNKVCFTGGAWAARRSVFPLYDKCVIGSGDAINIEGWTKKTGRTLKEDFNHFIKEDFNDWIEEANSKTKGIIGCLSGDVIHSYHGSYKNRKYNERLDKLSSLNFNPKKHVKIDENGLLSWINDAPEDLVEYLKNYFLNRSEDDNIN